MPDNGTQQNTDQPKLFNYFGLKTMDGMSDSAIHEAQKPNEQIILPTADAAWQKYGDKGIKSGKWKDQNDFSKQYQQVSDSYNNFRKAQDIHTKAKEATKVTQSAKQGEPVDVSRLFTPYRAPVEDVGLGKIKTASGGIARIGTDQQTAYDRGYAIDDTTGKKIDPKEMGFMDNIYITQDENGLPELHKGDMTKRLKEGQAVSWFGPEEMHSDWASSLLHAVGNGGLMSIPGQVGSLVRMASDLGSGMSNWLETGNFKSTPGLGDSIANVMENFSDHVSKSAESDKDSFMFNTISLVSSLAVMGEIGKGVGIASKTLGLGEDAALMLSKHTSTALGAGMVSEGFLKESHDMGIPDADAAAMGLGVFATSHFLLSKYGPNGVFGLYEKYIAQGSLKKTLQEGIDKEMEGMAEKKVANITPEGRGRIVRLISENIAKGLKALDESNTFGSNVLEGSIKGGAEFGSFQLLQNSMQVAYDTYKKHTDANAEQGEGLYFKRDSNVKDNLFTGVGSAMLSGFVGSGLTAGIQTLRMGREMSAELRSRYMEKEIVMGNYDQVVDLIKKEGAKGTWGAKGVDDKGVAIKQGEDKKDINTINTENLLQQAAMIKEMFDNGISDPKFLRDAAGGDKQLQLEALRHVKRMKEIDALLGQEQKENKADKKANTDVPGKSSVTDRINELKAERAKEEKAYDDIATGKRASEKIKDTYIMYEVQKNSKDYPANLEYIPSSKTVDDVNKTKQDIKNEEQENIGQRNIDNENIRTGVKEFNQAFTNYDKKGLGLLADETFMKRLDGAVQSVNHLAISPDEIKNISSFINDKIGEIDKLNADAEPGHEQQLESLDKLKTLKNKLDVQKLAEKLSKGGEANDEDKQLQSNHPAELETALMGIKNGGKEVFNQDSYYKDFVLNHALSNDTGSKIYHLADLASNDAKNPELANLSLNEINNLRNDLDWKDAYNKIGHRVYSKLDAKHTGGSDKVSDKQYEDTNTAISDLRYKLNDIEEGSGQAQADKANAQNKLRSSNLQYNQFRLKSISDIEGFKFDKETSSALDKAEKAVSDLKKSIKDNKGYDEKLLNEIEKQQSIVESSVHESLQTDTQAKQKKIIEKIFGDVKDVNNNYRFVPYQYPTEQPEGFSDLVYDKKDIPKEVNAYKVVNTLNYIDQLTHLDTRDYNYHLKAIIDETKEQFPSYEQTDLKGIVAHFIHPHNDIMGLWDEMRGTKSDVANPEWIDNGISLMGYGGTGKTTKMLPLALDIYKRMKGLKDDQKVLVIGPNEGSINKLIRSTKVVSKNVPDSFTISQFLAQKELSNKYDFIILDEASLLGKDDIKAINGLMKTNGNHDSRLLFLLDKYQSDKNGGSSKYLPVMENTKRTDAKTINYRTGIIVLQNVQDAYRKSIDSDSPVILPEAHASIDRKRGLEYFNIIDRIKKVFADDLNKKGSKELPILIVKDEAAREKIIKELLPLMDKGKDSLLEANVLTIYDNDLRHTAQGDERGKVYAMLIPEDFKGTWGNNSYARNMYTAISRVGIGAAGDDGYVGIYTADKNAKNGRTLNAGEGVASGLAVDGGKLKERMKEVVGNYVPEKSGAQTSTETEVPPNKIDGENAVDETIVPDRKDWYNESAKNYDKGIARLNTNLQDDKEIVSKITKLANSLYEGNKINIDLKPDDNKKYPNSVKGEWNGIKVSILHDVEGGFPIEGEKHNLDTKGFRYLNEDGTVNPVGSQIEAVNKGYKEDKTYGQSLRELQHVNLNNKVDVFSGKPVSLEVDHVTAARPIQTDDGSASINLTDLIKKYEKDYDFGTVKQAVYNGQSGMSIEVKPKGFKGEPVTIFVDPDKLGIPDIDRMVKDISGNEAESTINMNRALLVSEIKKGKLTEYFYTKEKNGKLRPEVQGVNRIEKDENLKKFYTDLKRDPDLRNQLKQWVGIKGTVEGKGDQVIDKDHPGYNKLKTNIKEIHPPEIYFKHGYGGVEENKNEVEDVLGVAAKKPEGNETISNGNVNIEEFLPDDEAKGQEPSKEDTVKIDNIRDYISLDKNFGTPAVKDLVCKQVRDVTGILNPQDILTEKYKSTGEKVKEYKQKLQEQFNKLPDDIKNKITNGETNSTNFLSKEGKEYQGYIIHELTQDGVLDKFLQHIYSETGTKLNIVTKEENSKHDVYRDINPDLYNAISKIKYKTYVSDEHGNIRLSKSTGGYVSADSLLKQLIYAGADESIAEGQQGMNRDERLISNLRSIIKSNIQGDGMLTPTGNNIASFIDTFLKGSDIEDPKSYSYKFIQENKNSLISKVPPGQREDFEKHYKQASDLINHFYSIVNSSTKSNYSFLIHKDGSGFNYLSHSPEAEDTLKLKFKEKSNNFIAEQTGTDKNGKGVFQATDQVKRNFTKDIVVNPGVISKGDKPLIHYTNKEGKLGFTLDANATPNDIRDLFGKMGIDISQQAIKMFGKDVKNKGDINFSEQRLADIAGTFSLAIKNILHEGNGIPGISTALEHLVGQVGGKIEVSDRPFPSDFRRYIENLSLAEHRATNDLSKNTVLNVEDEKMQVIKPGTYVSKTLSESNIMQGKFDNLKKEIALNPERLNDINNNALYQLDNEGKLTSNNHVLNGKITWTKLEEYNGIKTDFGKGAKFGARATSLDVYNMMMEPVFSDITSKNKYQTIHIAGEYGGDGTMLRMFPVKINGGEKILDGNGFTSEGRKYLHGSIKDIFTKYNREYEISKNKWKSHLQGKLTDEEWAMKTPLELEAQFNSLSENARKKLAKKIEADKNFIPNKDYHIKYNQEVAFDEAGDVAIPILSEFGLGHATTFNKNLGDIFTHENYQKVANGDYEGFYKQYIDAAKQSMEDKGFATKANSGLVADYLMLRKMVLANISPLVNGDMNQYKDYTDYQKRIKESPGQSGRVGGHIEQFKDDNGNPVEKLVYHGQPYTVNNVTLKDIHIPDEAMGMVANSTDGMQFIHPFYNPMFVDSFGGDMGVLGRGTHKLYTKFVNHDTGIASIIKSGTFQITGEQLDLSPERLGNVLRQMTSPALMEKFDGMRKTMGNTEAIAVMAKMLQDSPEMHNEIKHFATYESASKTGPTDKIESEHILFQLNTDEGDETHDESLLKQFINTVSIGAHNQKYIQGINDAQMEMVRNNFNKIKDRLQYDDTDPENRNRFHKVLKRMCYDNSQNIADVQMFIEALSHPDVSLDISSLNALANRILVKEFNKGIKPKIEGRSNVKGNSGFYTYRTGSDGNTYTPRDIAKMAPERISKLKLDSVPDEEYKDMRYEGGEMKPSETIGSFAHTDYFGLQPGEDINDVFTVHFKNGEQINTRNMTKENVEIMLRKEFGMIDMDKTIMFRQGLPKDIIDKLKPIEGAAEIMNPDFEEELKKHVYAVSNYRDEFDKSLYGVSIRTPSVNMGSGTFTKLHTILHDSPSLELSNEKRNNRDGSDNDIDKYTVNGYDIRSGNRENNKIMDNLIEAYKNKANKDLIFANVDPSSYREKKPSTNGLDRVFSDIKENVDGKNIIGIGALSNKGYDFLQQTQNVKPGLIKGLDINVQDKDIYGNSISTEKAKVLQMAVDNNKLKILGENNINDESVKVLNAILVYPGNIGTEVAGRNDRIKDAFDFLKQPHISSMYNAFERSKSVGEWQFKMDDLINNRIKDARANVTRIDEGIARIKNPNDPALQDAMGSKAIAEKLLNDYNTFKNLYLYGEGLSLLNGVFKIDSKAIESRDFDRKKEMEGSYGLEYLLNAPADVIFGGDYDKFQKENPEYFMTKTPLKLSKVNGDYQKALEKEKWLRSHFDYKAIFDNSPLIKEYWSQHNTVDSYINDNFISGKTYNDVEKAIKDTFGYQQFMDEQAFESKKEFDKFTTSIYYNMKYADPNKALTIGNEKIYLCTPEGRKRFSNEAVKWFRGLVSDPGKMARLSNNSLLKELIVNNRSGVDSIELRYGKQYAEPQIVQFQKDMLALKDTKTSFGEGISICDVLHHYSIIKDGFATGGNSMTKLFGAEGVLNYSRWIESTLIPSIREGRNITVYDKKGNVYDKTFTEALEVFKKDMPVKVCKEVGQNGGKRNLEKWNNDKEIAPKVYNQEGTVRDIKGNEVFNTQDKTYGYDVAREGSIKKNEDTQYIPRVTREQGERLGRGEVITYKGPEDAAYRTGLIHIQGYGDATITKEGNSFNLKLLATGTGDFSIKTKDESTATPSVRQQDLYAKDLPEHKGMSDITKFLSKTASIDINDDAYRKLAKHYLAMPHLISKLNDVKVTYADLSKSKAQGVYIREGNKRSIYIDTSKPRDIARVFLHEIHHAFLSDVLRTDNSKLSGHDIEFKNTVKGLLDEAKKYKLPNHISPNVFKNEDEFIAEGFSNKEFQQHLKSLPSVTPKTSLWRAILNHVADYFSNIFGFKKGELKDTLLNDLFATTTEYLRGADTDLGNKVNGAFYLPDDEEKNDIKKLKDLFIEPRIIEKENMGDYSHKIRSALFNKTNKDGNYVYHINNAEKIVIPASMKNDVNYVNDRINEIQERMSDWNESKKDKFINAVSLGGKAEDFDSLFGKKEEQSYFNENVINDIHNIIDFDANKGDKIMRLSQVKDFTIPEGMEGHDPMVIVHAVNDSEFSEKDKDGKPVQAISLVDMTGKNLNPSGENLYSKYMKPGKLKDKKITTLSASENGVRNFGLAVQMMAIRKANENIRIRKAMVMRPMRNSLEYSSILKMNPSDFLSELKTFVMSKEGANFTKLLPDNIKELLSDPDNNRLFNIDYGQDYSWQLHTEMEREAGNEKQYTKNQEIFRGIAQDLSKFKTKGAGMNQMLDTVKLRIKQLERMSGKDQESEEWKKEMNLLTQAKYEMANSNISKVGTTAKFSDLKVWLSQSTNIGDRLVEHATRELDRAQRSIAHDLVEYKNPKGTMATEINKLWNIHTILHAEDKMANRFSEGVNERLFEPVFKKVDGIEYKYDGKDKKKIIGEDKVRIRSMSVHTDINDPETKRAIELGEIPKEYAREYCEFGKYFSEEVKNTYRDALRHQILKNDVLGYYDNMSEPGTKAKLDRRVEKELSLRWTDGMVPLVEKSLGASLFGGNIKEWANRLERNLSNPNRPLENLTHNEKEDAENPFLAQMGSTHGLGNVEFNCKMLGTKYDVASQQLILDDKHANKGVSNDAEQILSALKMMTLRTIKYQNDVIPAYNDVRRILDRKKLESGLSDAYKNELKYLSESYLSQVKGDMHHLNIDVFGHDVEGLVQGAKTLSGHTAMGLNVPVAATIGMTNAFLSVITALSNNVGGSHMYGVKDLTKAAGMFGNAKLLRGLGDKYGVSNMSPHDILTNPEKQILKKSFFRSFYLHWLTYGVDYTCRTWLMTAQMIKDGSMEAHTYNEKTGQVDYDEKKDKRYWNEDGSQSKEQRLMREATKNSLVRDGLIKEEDTKLPKAYGFDTGEKLLKDVSDKVIYTMGHTAHTNIQNSMLGMVFHQFKSFALGQLEQVFAAPYQRETSGHMVITKDEYGNDVARLQPESYEGRLYTLAHTLKDLKTVLKNPKEYWTNLTPKQKSNLARISMEAILFSGLYMMYNQQGKKKTRLMESIENSGMDLVNPYYPGYYVNWMKNPMPMASFASNSLSTVVALMHADASKALTSFPVAKSDTKMIEQIVGYKPEREKKKQVAE